ncbi:MAG: hypothetical protein RL410_842 [Actinomycetota bacterium]|jgi:putative metallohydrolase (TIGR04338 family)
MATERDHTKHAVYAAELQVRSTMERFRHDTHATVDFFGSTLTVVPERIFATLDEMKSYVNDVIEKWNSHRNTRHTVPHVRERKSAELAHYEYDTKVIAIPTKVDWAMRELVVLHEVAHHIAMSFDTRAPHGPEFAATYVELVSLIMGNEAGLLLRAAFDGQQVRVGIAR